MSLYTTAWPEKGLTLLQHADGRSVAGPVATHVYPATSGPLGSNVPHSADLLNAVATYAAEFDVIITHSLWNPVATFSRRILRRKHKKYCVMPHGMLDQVVFRRGSWKKSAWASLWERKNVEQAALLLFNTQTEQEKATECGWQLPQSIVLPHIIDLSSWKNLPPGTAFESLFPQAQGKRLILFVGRINWVKNIDKLIESLAIVRRRRPSVALVCVGPSDNGHRVQLECKMRELGQENSVMFTGMLRGEQLKAAYARADLLALVSQKENFGLVVAEALAAGLPVVVSTGVDLSTNWVSKGPVRRVEPGPASIAQAIIELLERTDKQPPPDIEARALAEKEWGSSRIDILLEAYRSISSAEHA